MDADIFKKYLQTSLNIVILQKFFKLE